MARNISIRAAAAALTLLATAQTPPPQKTYVGIQGLFVAGVHRDIAGSQYGLGAGPLVQVHVVRGRFAAHVEGIPVVSIPDTRPSAAYGQATPALGIFNAQLEYAATRDRTLWIGLGETAYNQRTPLPNINQVVASRLGGVRYTLRYERAMRNARFIEALLGAAPSLYGSDHFTYSDGTPPVDKPERASEVDASLALGYRRKSSEWLIGLRTVNFTAKFLNTGAAADRNVGLGPMIEWRHLLP